MAPATQENATANGGRKRRSNGLLQWKIVMFSALVNVTYQAWYLVGSVSLPVDMDMDESQPLPSEHYTDKNWNQIENIQRTSTQDNVEDTKAVFDNQEPTKLDVDPSGLFPFEMPRESSTPIFYHIDMPSNEDDDGAHSKRIVLKQLDQIQRASTRQQIKHQQTLSIYFTTIGSVTDYLNADLIIQWCHERSLVCHHMERHSVTQDVTLQRVHDYCRAVNSGKTSFSKKGGPTTNAARIMARMKEQWSETKRRRVVYMSNKGHDDHDSLFHEKWRHTMTDAVTSDHCLHPDLYGASDCNLCGMFFVAEHGFSGMVGNFWTTSCDYIAELLPVRDFASNHRSFEQHTYQPDIGRMAANEFWAGSHPDVKPCDFSNCLSKKERKHNKSTEAIMMWIRENSSSGSRKLVDSRIYWWVPRAAV
ncbi:expressed unknown protein [Seminavis robusta]|uniref:Uncharacterized protein n=1 Tax=Seminavis robusta TaxID=568900 RepID=A0A9N8DIQ0_9STRA|nr:expressed unknown protein [Seminavis robusta]|eukprot:Sro107_g053770.1 n/a (419) ;mRNA; r:25620-26876